jgi:hypothetical protein
MRECSICSHPKLTLIEAELHVTPASRVARKYHVSAVQLRRHRIRHIFRRAELEKLATSDPSPSLLVTVSRLLTKTEALASSALARGDLRASASLLRKSYELAELQHTIESRTLARQPHGLSPEYANQFGHREDARNDLFRRLGMEPMTPEELAAKDRELALNPQPPRTPAQLLDWVDALNASSQAKHSTKATASPAPTVRDAGEVGTVRR